MYLFLQLDYLNMKELMYYAQYAEMHMFSSRSNYRSFCRIDLLEDKLYGCLVIRVLKSNK